MRLGDSFLALSIALTCGCALLPDSSTRLSVERPLTGGAATDSRLESVPNDPVSAAVFAQINADRAHEGLAPVAWDATAADLAASYTREQIREGTVGHFLLDGVPPYARLSRVGDFAMGAENAVAFMSIGDRLGDSPTTLALRGQREMIQEKPPGDGHRRAILDPAATHVGVGWSMSETDFRMVEEFTSRCFTRLDVLPVAHYASAIRVRGEALPGMSIDYVSVARQPLPAPISITEANARRSYAYPDPRFALLPAAAPYRTVGVPSRKCLVPSVHGRFSFDYQIDEPGMWTFVLYFRKKDQAKPVPGGSFTLWVRQEDAVHGS